jgi:serine/threonine protein phosphatase PrpC
VWTQLTKDHAYSEPLLKAGLIKDELDREQLVQRADIEKVRANTTDAGTKQALTLLLEIYDAEKDTELPLGYFNWVVYGSLGYSETEIHPNTSFIDLEDGDELYTMTDGPYENISLERFEQIRLSVASGDLTEVCKNLCEAAQAANKKPDDNLVAGQRVKIQSARKAAPTQSVDP